MFPLMLVLISLSISTVLPWAIAVLIWRQRRFMPIAAPWFALTNLFAGGEAAFSMVGLISRNPRTVFWAEAGLALSAALAAWAFFVGMLALVPQFRRWMKGASVVGFLLAVPPWFYAVQRMLPRLRHRDYMIYNLGDYPIIRFFIHIPWDVELAIFVLPSIVFTAGMVIVLRVYREFFIRRRMRPVVLATLFLSAALVVYLHRLHLQGVSPFAAINPMPTMIWSFALALGWLVLNRNFGMIMPIVGPDVLERSKEAILVADRQARLTWWNRSAQAWLQGPTPLGRPLEELLRPYPPLLEIFRQPEAAPREVRLEHPEQGEMFVEAYALDIEGRSGLPIGRALIFYDLTPWRKLQQRDAFQAAAERLGHELLALVLEPQGLEPSLAQAARLLHRGLGAQHPAAVGIWLLDDDGRRLWLAAWEGPEPRPPDGVDAQPGWWQADMFAVDEALRPPQAQAQGWSGWAFPLQQGEQPLGLVTLEAAFAPSPEVRQVWRAAADSIALLITRRREAQHLQLLQAVHENIQEIVIIFDAHGFIVEHNPAAAMWVGVPSLKGQLVAEILPTSPGQAALIERALAQEGRWFDVFETTLPDGRQAVLEMSLVALPESMGRMAVAVIRDITEREFLRRDLERQKTFLENLLRISRTLLAAPLSLQETWRAALRVGQDLLNASNASLILVDENLRVTDYFVEEHTDLSDADYQAMVQEVIDRGFAGRALRAGRMIYSPDTETDDRWIFADRLPWKSVVSVPLFYQGKPLGVMTFSSEEKRHFSYDHLRLLETAADMIALAVYQARLYEEQFHLSQELLRAKEEAEDLRRRQEAFFANLSHEMRTPLQAILGYLEWLRMAEEGFLEYDEELRQIETAAQRLLAIVNLVLEYRRSQEEEAVSVEPFALRAVVDEVHSLVAPLAQRNNDRLEIDIQPADLTLEADRQKVLHILLNLVSNAVKFTENGRVVVRARPETDDQGREWVRLEVEDTGIGIPEEDLPTIFEPFRQAGGEAQRHKGGTGLGLALVKRYTELLGGTVTVRSRVGQGTTFTVRLPRMFQPQPAPQEEAP